MSTTYTPAADILRPVALATVGVTLVTRWLVNGFGDPSPSLVCGDDVLCMDEGGADDAGAMLYVWSEFLRDGGTWELMGDGCGNEGEARAAAHEWAARITR